MECRRICNGMLWRGTEQSHFPAQCRISHVDLVLTGRCLGSVNKFQGEATWEVKLGNDLNMSRACNAVPSVVATFVRCLLLDWQWTEALISTKSGTAALPDCRSLGQAFMFRLCVKAGGVRISALKDRRLHLCFAFFPVLQGDLDAVSQLDLQWKLPRMDLPSCPSFIELINEAGSASQSSSSSSSSAFGRIAARQDC